MAEEDGVPTVYAIVTRMGETGQYELCTFEFLKGIAGFTQWAAALPKHIRSVESGGRTVQMGQAEMYSAETEANVVAVVMTPRGGTYQYSWKTDEMGWNHMKTLITNQDREARAQGRPRKLVQPLQTWRMWAKKDGALL